MEKKKIKNEKTIKKQKVRPITEEKMITANVDYDLFDKACKKIIGKEQGLKGIGTLSEKTVHAVLKYYYAPREDYHEIKIGSYVADICREGEIYEIQSKSFHLMRKKLDCFLKEHDVTIVYPVPLVKYIRWVDVDTGEISPRKKSPLHGKLYDILPELYGIKNYLQEENLHFILCFIEMEEYKLLDGYSASKKKGATKSDRIPTAIKGEFFIDKKEDYLNLLPKSILDVSENVFTSSDLALEAGCHVSYARLLLHLLNYLELVERIGKKGNTYLYKIKR